MANNRMLLICNVCNPTEDWNFGSEGILHIAKWYPGGDGAYYRDNTDSMGKDFEEFVTKHAHTELPSEHYLAGAGQPNPVRIGYESIDMPVLNTKK